MYSEPAHSTLCVLLSVSGDGAVSVFRSSSLSVHLKDLLPHVLFSQLVLQVIKVVTGFRRCGKSTLLMQFRYYLNECGVEDGQIISVNFKRLEFEYLLEHHALTSLFPTDEK
ncbi:MAG: AAA family ATPase [Oscillospiraceae bacterium]